MREGLDLEKLKQELIDWRLGLLKQIRKGYEEGNISNWEMGKLTGQMEGIDAIFLQLYGGEEMWEVLCNSNFKENLE